MLSHGNVLGSSRATRPKGFAVIEVRTDWPPFTPLPAGFQLSAQL
jgi:hypothetical protein